MERAESLLLPDHTDRARMLDMDRRLQPIRRAALAVLALGLVIIAPWVGWWTFLPLLLAGALFRGADARLDHVERPEYWIFGAWTGAQAMIALSVLLAGGLTSPSMAWFAIPVVTLSTRFSIRGVALGVAITIAMMLVVAFGFDAAAVIDYPPLLVAPVALVIAIGILSTALMRSDVQHRSEAVIDPLTAMLNRKALDNRVEELRQQSAITGDPIGVIVIDIDHFKRINDTVGHAVGDAVLRDVAYLIRKDLRAFELAYRLGGEEFLVLLPGADEPQARQMAEGLREAIGDARFPEGLAVTVSCGVSATPPGKALEDFATLFAAADGALYEAKRSGRNRVRSAGAGEVAEPLESAWVRGPEIRSGSL